MHSRKDLLQAAISHWEEIVAVCLSLNQPEERPRERSELLSWLRNNTGASSCPLCQVFLSYNGCAGCPVQLRSGADFCRKTPYGRFSRLLTRVTVSWDSNTNLVELRAPPRLPALLLRLAERELAYLKSLLDTPAKTN
jgi:hypothetical protein